MNKIPLNKPRSPEEELTRQKLKAVRAHRDAWEDRFDDLIQERLKQFGTEPLDKKTAVMCTAYVVDAIKELTESITFITRKTHPEIDTEGLSAGPWEMQYSGAPYPWLGEILTRLCWAGDGERKDDPLIDAYCHVEGFRDVGHHSDQVDHMFSKIEKTPIPSMG